MSIANKIKLNGELEISRIVSGVWRLAEWKLSDQELLRLIKQSIELGVTTFDHADIYGNYECEKLFGRALSLDKDLKSKIEIITKCGIVLTSDKFPNRKLKVYDYSFNHIVGSVERSLVNLGIDHIDLLLLHRPAPFFNPEEVAHAFSHLHKQGKVLHFGVSNFSSMQFEMLNAYTDEKLVTNQVEISPYCLEHVENGNMDFFLKEKIKPMAWSPLAGGKLLNPTDEKSKRIHEALSAVATSLQCSMDQVIYTWLLNHPSGIVPIVGTSKIERIKNAVDALELKMNLEQWYAIFNASIGKELP